MAEQETQKANFDTDDQVVAVTCHKDYQMKKLSVEFSVPSHPGILMLLIKHLDAMGEQIAQASLVDTGIEKNDYKNAGDLLEALATQEGRMISGSQWVQLTKDMSDLCNELSRFCDDEIKEFLGPDLEALLKKMGVADSV
tara:strand:+ start:728 stop:1147 length:420 start_codon:yes stop_codon:yes gene_type:complete